MSLLLRVFDNADGTGGTVQVTGSDSGSTNLVQAQPINGSALGGAAFETVATLTGNGNADALLGVGYFWFVLTSTSSGVATIAPLIYQNFTDDAAAVYERIIQAVLARLQGLNLAATPNETAPVVLRQKALDPGQFRYPAVDVTIDDLEISVEPEDFEDEDHVFYPVMVRIRDRADLSDQTNTGRYLLWSQQIARALRNQRLAGVPEVLDCEISDWKAASKTVKGFQIQESSFLAKFRAGETFG